MFAVADGLLYREYRDADDGTYGHIACRPVQQFDPELLTLQRCSGLHVLPRFPFDRGRYICVVELAIGRGTDGRVHLRDLQLEARKTGPHEPTILLQAEYM